MVVQVGDAILGRVPMPGERDHDQSESHVLQLDRIHMHGLGLPSDVAGMLVVTSRRLCWTSTQGGGYGAAIPITDIGLHAVSRDSASEYGPCIYIQVGEGDDEVRIVPQDPSTELDRIWEALCSVSGFVHEEGDHVSGPRANYFDNDETGAYGDEVDENAERDAYANAEEETELYGVAVGGYSLFDRLNSMLAEQERLGSSNDPETEGLVNGLDACAISPESQQSAAQRPT